MGLDWGINELGVLEAQDGQFNLRIVGGSFGLYWLLNIVQSIDGRLVFAVSPQFYFPRRDYHKTDDQFIKALTSAAEKLYTVMIEIYKDNLTNGA